MTTCADGDTDFFNTWFRKFLDDAAPHNVPGAFATTYEAFTSYTNALIEGVSRASLVGKWIEFGREIEGAVVKAAIES